MPTTANTSRLHGVFVSSEQGWREWIDSGSAPATPSLVSGPDGHDNAPPRQCGSIRRRALFVGAASECVTILAVAVRQPRLVLPPLPRSAASHRPADSRSRVLRRRAPLLVLSISRAAPRRSTK